MAHAAMIKVGRWRLGRRTAGASVHHTSSKPVLSSSAGLDISSSEFCLEENSRKSDLRAQPLSQERKEVPRAVWYFRTSKHNDARRSERWVAPTSKLNCEAHG